MHSTHASYKPKSELITARPLLFVVFGPTNGEIKVSKMAALDEFNYDLERDLETSNR